MRFSPALKIAAVALLFMVLAFAAAWPLGTNPAGLALFGLANNDAQFNTYVIFWGAHSLLTDPLSLHHTNMFYPERYTFAYSDIELSHSLLMLPVILVFNNPYLVFNLLLMLSIAIGGVGFYLLAVRLTGNHSAAVFAAAIYVFNPAHFGRYLQIQFFADHWLPWFAWALLRWLEGIEKNEGFRLLRAFAAALFYCLHALSGSHNTVYGTVLGAGLVVFYFFKRRLWKSVSFWAGIGLMAVVSLAVLGPIFFPYLIVEDRLSAGRVMDADTLVRGSATLQELLSAGSKFYTWVSDVTGWPTALFDARLRGYLFPGFVALFLAGIGFIAPRRKKSEENWKNLPAWALDFISMAAALLCLVCAAGGAEPEIVGKIAMFYVPSWAMAAAVLVPVALRLALFRRSKHLLAVFFSFCRERLRAAADQLFWLGLTVFALLAALGPDGGLYYLLAHMPLIRLIRIPQRFVLLAAFALAVLCAYGAAALGRRLGGRRALAGVVFTVIVLAFVVEADFAPLHVRPVEQVPEVYLWLAERQGDFTVVEFPLDPLNYSVSARQVFYSVYHWKRLLVGFSGYQSPENVERLRRLNDTFPSDSCLDELEELGVRYVFVFEDRLAGEDQQNGSDKLEKLRSRKRLDPVKRFGETGELAVYLLKPSGGE
jgi:hypothetical protein